MSLVREMCSHPLLAFYFTPLISLHSSTRLIRNTNFGLDFLLIFTVLVQAKANFKTQTVNLHSNLFKLSFCEYLSPFVATFIKSNSLAHICIFSQTIHTYDAITAPLYSVCLYKSRKTSNNYVMSQRCLRSLTHRRLLVMEVVPCQKLIRRVPSTSYARTSLVTTLLPEAASSAPPLLPLS